MSHIYQKWAAVIQSEPNLSKVSLIIDPDEPFLGWTANSLLKMFYDNSNKP